VGRQPVWRTLASERWHSENAGVTPYSANLTSLAGQLWSDEPAKVDYLAARAIAETVAEAVLDDALDPLSLGLSGPWGSGKTTVLELVSSDLTARSSDDDRVVVVRTDPWRYDPSVGAKESIIADVLAALAEELESNANETTGGQAKELLKKLAKRVDWAKALKLAATTTLALQIPSFDDITGLLKEPGTGDEPGEQRGLAGFHEEFATLLGSEELKHVRRVAVLVDDLDRCLARTVVESLEAIRLFLSVPKMAFVIAADEERVADAIRSELPAWEMPKERAGGPDALPPEPPWKLYLHKIVQTTVPLPALGAFDTEAYLLLLQVQNRTGNVFTEEQLDALIAECGRLRSAGALDGLTAPTGTDVQSELAFAHRLTAILYEKLAGNPRRIKRFLNDMNVRRSIAARRGIPLESDVVAKLMVLEVLLPEQFKEVLAWLRTSELRDRLAALEIIAGGSDAKGLDAGAGELDNEEMTAHELPAPKKAESNMGAGSRAKAAVATPDPAADDAAAAVGEANDPPPAPARAADALASTTVPVFGDDLVRWAKLEPPLAQIDLSPYLHLAASFSGDLLISEELPQRLRDAAAQLMSTGPIGNKAAEEQAGRLPVDDAALLIRYFARRGRDRVQDQRGSVTAIGRLAAAHPTLAASALDALKRLPVEHLQVATVVILRGLPLDGIDKVLEDFAARATGPAKAALTAPAQNSGLN
jgi:hypothetical protein